MDDLAAARARMVASQLERRGIHDPGVLRAMGAVPRHRFMPPDTWPWAYGDHPVAIGDGQTISQPYIVALMTELSGARPGSRVLDVGTGSGYQAAVLAELGADVYSVEIVPALAARARATLDAAGYGRVHTRVGDGYRGWPEHAPYDAIVLAAAPDHVPRPLLDQLGDGGRLVLPVGAGSQDLLVVTRDGDRFVERRVLEVVFVPMTGEGAARRR